MPNADKYRTMANRKWTLSDIKDFDSSLTPEEGFYIGQYTEAELTEVNHSHEFFQLYYIFDGILIHSVGGLSDYITKGDVFLIPPAIHHRLTNENGRPVTFASVGFSAEAISFLVEEGSFLETFLESLSYERIIESSSRVKPRISFDANSQFIVESLIKLMRAEYVQRQPGYDCYIKGLLSQLLVIVARAYMEDPYYSSVRSKLKSNQDIMVSCIEYVNAHFTENLKIDSLARSFLFSRSRFCNVFRKMTGKSLGEYVTDMRIAYSKELLENTTASITDVAYECGFGDITNFSRTFSRQIGISPSEYRRNAKLKVGHAGKGREQR